VSLRLQAVAAWPERVARLNSFFETYRSCDEYDTEAIHSRDGLRFTLPGEFIKPRDIYNRG
jgi:hypothetical protein